MSISRFLVVGTLFVSCLGLEAQDAVPAATNAPASAAVAETNAAPVAIPPFEMVLAAAAPVGADGLIVQSDNQHAPYMAVFKGSVNGVAKPFGAKNCDAYAAWLNRKVVWAEDNQPMDWGNVEGQSWQLAPWGAWVDEVPGRRFILGVSIIPGSWDGKGPKTGPGAGQPVSFELGAAGQFNEHYKKLAEHLVKYHLGNSILRLGVEFNGGWFPWHVLNEKKAEAFAGYWKQIVTTMRAVPGAEHLQFCWNPGATVFCAFKPDTAWPGDDMVDYIGLDFYDDAYGKDTYPWPKTATPEEIEAIHEKVWDKVYMNGAFGLAYWKKFAEQHHTPLCFPEWGVDNKPDHHGGGDDPYFVEQMYKFIYTPANNVAWHSYFDYQAGDGHHQLAPKADGTVITEFPKSSEKFKELFSLPAGDAAPAAK